MAMARFLCWLRSFWHCTTMPVGRCVRRMALEVLLTCWPPAPLARKTSSRMSSSRISIVDLLGDLGRDVDGGETGLPLAFGVEGADADQAVDARLALQIAVGHRPADGDRGAVDAGLFVVLAVEQLGRRSRGPWPSSGTSAAAFRPNRWRRCRRRGR